MYDTYSDFIPKEREPNGGERISELNVWSI